MHPEYFAIRRDASAEEVLDPRRPAPATGEARARLRVVTLEHEVGRRIADRLHALVDQGAAGFVFDGLEASAAPFLRKLLPELRKRHADLTLVAATPGLSREDAVEVAGCGFDYCLSSFGWWDMKARWLVEEHRTLAPICPLLAEITPAAASRASDPAAAHALLAAARFTGTGVIVPGDFAARLKDHAGPDALGERSIPQGGIEFLTSVGAPVTGLVHYDSLAERDARWAMVLLLNPTGEPQAVPATLLDGQHLRLSRKPGGGDALAVLAPHEARLIELENPRAINSKPRGSRKAATSAATLPRIVIENLAPSVAGGPFAVKCVVGERIDVSAHIYADGHEKIGARLLWRAEDEKEWRAVPMLEESNDEWFAAFAPERVGRHEYTVEAWDDRFGYFRESIGKKVEAGVAQPVEFEEGRLFLKDARDRADAGHRDILEQALGQLAQAGDDRDRRDVFTDPAVIEAMEALDPHHHRAIAAPVLVDAERREAGFSSWYELFPRSMTDDKTRHGTLRNVIDHLPRVAAMGFDTLYFPPIHPIGTINRKGPNNTLTPEDGDPGSPYAIGSAEGGHDAIHSELGTFEDFRALVSAAKDHGLEIALDFAIQCSPDHPWLKEHPGWFAWRPDGSMKYAENPPKKYQDIVNVDFYRPDAVPDLWLALRDVVLLWVSEGVKVFRVDNPHTKPFAFWEWMIREVRAAHPEVIFLSEAFTRPKVMYRLAKIGFSQSYTYFTWRNSKAELTEYIEELTQEAPKDFFRPHFFVNTPDINPVFLQTGGRPAHRIRAVLAATLSGLWGVYSGFELCDAAPLPGREEYADSEKYEIRPRNWRAPGDIVEDVTLLNRLRRSHPALQTHRNTIFLPAHNDNIIYYAKPAPDGDEMILVAVNLDPHGAHGCEFEVPLWKLGLPDDGEVAVEDLASGASFRWQGKVQSLHLTPDDPYRIWRIAPEGGAHG
ncbi:alpha-1,4-glucan--maltose-1-phosphate maltosyltransferase [Erythrobacter sp.]|uniref:alpha-1,4-glucan--maltose-1-phosphate maltosyltransferase n=1 Tax=Erythrobacter sp. TaxID=1042 RepID=UPI0025DCD38B|nr:alpha-1,4-glucan--maltose-1-phosphate maltosyltransferase [Erythrobacter sp.]